jgi:hypothetical protein
LYLFGLASFFAVLVGGSVLLLAQKAQRAEATATLWVYGALPFLLPLHSA